jgi:conjugal transfer/entry exclusion protein
MKQTVEMNLELKANQIYNKFERIEAIQEKLAGYQEELDRIQKGLTRDWQFIEELGMKVKTEQDSVERLQAKSSYNEELLKQKISLIKTILDSKSPQVWLYVEANLPDHLKGLGIDQ